MTSLEKEIGTVGFIGRFKPLHKGAALALDLLCEQADWVKIGIGSANKYNLRNPFTAEETEAMLRTYLSPRHANYEIIHVPDFAQNPEDANGQRWKEYVVEHFGKLNYFISGNPHVQQLLQDKYPIIHPASRIPRERWIQLRATEVRVEMAKGSEQWKDLVPVEVAQYLQENQLLERFQQEFGEATLRDASSATQYRRTEKKEEESRHAREK